MAIQALLITSKNNYLCGFEQVLRENSIDLQVFKISENISDTMRNIDIIIHSGADEDDSWKALLEIKRDHPEMPVVSVFPASASIAGKLGDPEGVKWIQPLTSKKKFLQTVVDLVRQRRILKSKAMEPLTNPPFSIQKNFFDTIEINEVLDQALSHFGSKVLCKNIHWIQWSEIQHLSEADVESLNLEIETKYHRTPKIRSKESSEVRHIVDLARSFPLKKRLHHLAQGGHLLQTARGTQHLLFPIQCSEGKKNIACLLVEDLHDGESEFIVNMMRDVLKRMVRHIEFGYQLWEARNLSFSDDLTDLYNQRYLPHVLDTEISRARRTCTKFSVLFMDLDHFKKVNDSKGHWVGSKLLVEVGKVVKSNIRSCDYGFRYGGDEYVVILVDTDVKGAEIVGERLRKEVEEAHFLVDGHRIKLTISVGVACFPDHAANRQDIIKMADEAMYLGKHKSRNIVYVAG